MTCTKQLILFENYEFTPNSSLLENCGSNSFQTLPCVKSEAQRTSSSNKFCIQMRLVRTELKHKFEMKISFSTIPKVALIAHIAGFDAGNNGGSCIASTTAISIQDLPQSNAAVCGCCHCLLRSWTTCHQSLVAPDARHWSPFLID